MKRKAVGPIVLRPREVAVNDRAGRRDAKAIQVGGGQRRPTDMVDRDDPAEQEVAQVCHRISQCRQLPVDYANHLGTAVCENDVVESVVAMHEGYGVVRRNVCGQPLRERRRFGGIVAGGPHLAVPSLDLP